MIVRIARREVGTATIVTDEQPSWKFEALRKVPIRLRRPSGLQTALKALSALACNVEQVPTSLAGGPSGNGSGNNSSRGRSAGETARLDRGALRFATTRRYSRRRR